MQPEVSILIPNYNYADTLRECLNSVLNQTYPNIEVIIGDNHSSDNSYEIMQEFRDKFIKKGIWCNVIQHKVNIGSNGNYSRCLEQSYGDYFLWLSSDDSLQPDAIEKMLPVLAEHPEAGCVMAHRNEIDENGNLTETAPFYNQSCIIKGEDQAAVYMMAGIAVPSQILWRKSAYVRLVQNKFLRFQVAGDWYDNFLMACISDIIYIKLPLVNYRIQSKSETGASEKNLVGIMEHYMLVNAFCSIADSFGLTKPQKRRDEAIRKLSFMCLRYARKMIFHNENEVARKYLKMADVFYDDIDQAEEYQKLWTALDSENAMKYLQENDDADNGIYVRTISYDPPANSIRLPELE